MTTLKDVLISKKMSPVDLASKAGLKSVTTVYKLYRKEEGVAYGTVKRVCQVLGLTLDQYDQLDECPRADRERQREETGSDAAGV